MTNKELSTFYNHIIQNNWIVPEEYLTENNIKVFIKKLFKIKKCKTDEDILKIYSIKLLKDNGLEYLLDKYDNIYDIIQIVYPDRFKIWEIKDGILNPQLYWKDEKNIIDCLKWIIEDKLKYTTEDINKYEAYRINIELKLEQYINIRNIPSLSILLEKAYPNRYNIWLFGRRMPKNYWDNKNNIIRAMKWLLEGEYNIFEDSNKKLTKKILSLYGLGALIKKYSLYDLVELAYPGEFKAWEICIAPRDYWNHNTSVEAFKWLIEEKLQISPNEIVKKVNKDVIHEYGLQKPFEKIFHKSRTRIKETLYPKEEC